MNGSTLIVVLDPENGSPSWGVVNGAQLVAIPDDRYDEATDNDLIEEFHEGEPLGRIIMERNAYRSALLGMIGRIEGLPVDPEDVGLGLYSVKELLKGTSRNSIGGIKAGDPSAVIATAEEMKESGLA